MLYPSHPVPAIADKYVSLHVHRKNPRPFRFGLGITTSAYERRKDCCSAELVTGVHRLARELFIKDEDRRVVKVRRVAVGTETADRKGPMDSPLIAAVAIVTARK